MKLIIDANRLFSLIIGKKLSSVVMKIFFSDEAELFAPFRIFAELENNREEIRSKSSFSHEDFDNFVGVLKLKIKFVPLEDIIDDYYEFNKHKT